MEFWAPFSDAIWGEKQRWRGLEMSTVSQVIIARDSIFLTWKHLRISSENLWKKIIIFQEFGEKESRFPMLWTLLYSWKKWGLLVVGSMLNLVRVLNLRVRLCSTGLALKVRLHFRTSSHLSLLLLLLFFFCLKMDKNRLFQEGPDLKPKKTLLVSLLLFLEGIVGIVSQKNYVWTLNITIKARFLHDIQ